MRLGLRHLLLAACAVAAHGRPSPNSVLTVIATASEEKIPFFSVPGVADLVVMSYGDVPVPCPVCVHTFHAPVGTKWQLLAGLAATAWFQNAAVAYDWLFFPDDGALLPRTSPCAADTPSQIWSSRRAT